MRTARGVQAPPSVAAPTLAALSELLELRAEVDARDSAGCTPLSRASIAGAVDVVRLLLEAGANPAMGSKTIGMANTATAIRANEAKSMAVG